MFPTEPVFSVPRLFFMTVLSAVCGVFLLILVISFVFVEHFVNPAILRTAAAFQGENLGRPLNPCFDQSIIPYMQLGVASQIRAKYKMEASRFRVQFNNHKVSGNGFKNEKKNLCHINIHKQHTYLFWFKMSCSRSLINTQP